jgi:hypothetical protein
MIFGSFDGMAGFFAVGWAWDESAPEDAQYVEIFADRRPVGVARADFFRQDLAAAGVGNGRHGFQYLLPPALLDGREHTIEAAILGAGLELRGSPLRFLGRSGEVPYGNMRAASAGAGQTLSPGATGEASRAQRLDPCSVAQRLRREGYQLLTPRADTE